MKNIKSKIYTIIVISFLSLSTVVMAENTRDDGPANSVADPYVSVSGSCSNSGDVALKACKKTGGFKTFCERAVSNNHADERAASMCSNIPNIPDNLRYNCIKATVNKTYSRAELRECMLKNGFKQVDCITNKGAAYLPGLFTPNFGEKAHQACTRTGGFKRLCEKAVGQNHADEAAVSVCASTNHIPDNLRYDCIKSTINKIFTRSEILKCLSKKGFKRVDCISNSGDVIIPSLCN